MMDELEINPRIISVLKKAKLTKFSTILSLSAPDLERATQLSSGDVAILHKAVAQAIPCLPVTTALDLMAGTGPKELCISYLTTGCEVLDKFLRGGILNRGITEIAGESASGKTQLCMQLCLNVQLPTNVGGLGSGAVFICTEDAFPNKRLHQMMQAFKLKHADKAFHQSSLGDNIFIEHAAEMADLWHCIDQRVPMLLNRGRIKLIVLDSIAALFRCEYSVRETVKRAKQLTSFGARLHQLSCQHAVPIICVNQVSAVVDGSQRNRVIPALGISWANLVTSRLMLSKTYQSVQMHQKDQAGKIVRTFDATVRKLEVGFAPHLPKAECYYVIDQAGVKGLT